MSNIDSLITFHKFCQSMGLHYNLSYSEGEDCWEVEVFSAAPSEGLHWKRCWDLDMFIRDWKVECSNG